MCHGPTFMIVCIIFILHDILLNGSSYFFQELHLLLPHKSFLMSNS